MSSLLLNTASRLVVIVSQLIMIKLYTGNLPIDQIGIYFFCLAVSYSANTLIFIPLDYYQQANLRRILGLTGSVRSIFDLNLLVMLVFICCVLAITLWFYLFLSAYVFHVVIVGAISVTLHIVQSLRNTLNNLEYQNYMSISYIQESVIRVFSFILLIKFSHISEISLLGSWLAALIGTSIYLTYSATSHSLFKRGSVFRIDPQAVFVFCKPFSISASLSLMQQQGYRFIMVPLGMVAEVGLFATLSGIGSAATGAVSLIYSQQFTPRLYKSKGTFTWQYIKGAVICLLVVSLIALLFGEFAVELLTQQDFLKYWWLLFFGLLTDGATMVIAALVISLTLSGNTKNIVSSGVVGVVTTASIFCVLYLGDRVSLYTLGIPMLIAQWTVVLFLVGIYGYRQKNQTF